MSTVAIDEHARCQCGGVKLESGVEGRPVTLTSIYAGIGALSVVVRRALCAESDFLSQTTLSYSNRATRRAREEHT